MRRTHYSKEEFRRLRRRWDRVYFMAAVAFVLSFALLFACTLAPDSNLINPWGFKNPEFFPLSSLVVSIVAFFVALGKLKDLARKGSAHVTNTEG